MDTQKDQALLALTQTRAIAVADLDEIGIIESLMYHYNRYRGLKAFLLDINKNEIGYKAVSTFLVATSPDTDEASNDPIQDIKDWVLQKITELNNPNLTLVISCPASTLYRFAEVIDKAEPPLANIDFAPLHDFDNILNDTKLKYDMLLIERSGGELPADEEDQDLA